MPNRLNELSNISGKALGAGAKYSGAKAGVEALGRVATNVGQAAAGIMDRGIVQQTAQSRMDTLGNLNKLNQASRPLTKDERLLSTLDTVSVVNPEGNPKIQEFTKRMLRELEPLAVTQPQSVKQALVDGVKAGAFTLAAAASVNQLVNLASGIGGAGGVAKQVFGQHKQNAAVSRGDEVQKIINKFDSEYAKFKETAGGLERFFEAFKNLPPTGGMTSLPPRI